MSAWPVMALLSLLAVLAGCQGDCPLSVDDAGVARGCGASVIRWRLVSAASGAPAPACQVSSGRTGTVTVDEVALEVSDLDGQRVACDSCTFPCAPLEGTTRFTLPAGTYSFRVRGLKCRGPVGFSPPAVLRQVRAGAVTNLNAVEILIPEDEPTDDRRQGCDGGT